MSLPCKPCDESGEQVCDQCDGEYEMENASCSACMRTGKNLDDEGEPMECVLCKGEGEISTTVNSQGPCPKCQP